MDPNIETALLQSIDADRLVVVCGAGLSMAGRSRLPSAKDVARRCYDEYAVLKRLPPEMRDDLEAIAEHFASTGSLQTYFIPRLVPWKAFVAEPNDGHAAVADMLMCHALQSGITTNYDYLVEDSARRLHADFDSSLDGVDAVKARDHAVYLKIHGCSVKDRQQTVWAPSQLNTDAGLIERIARSKTWLAAHIPHKDYLFVGFWSDWNYLNNVLEATLSTAVPASVFVVDPSSTADLQSKAPALWQLFVNAGAVPTHIRQSGDVFLNELRCAFSRLYLRQALLTANTAFQTAAPGRALPSVPIETSVDAEDLYAARCDAEGIPRTYAARKKQPQNAELFALSHLLLVNAGATANGTDYDHGGLHVRVINGAGSTVGHLMNEYANEPTSLPRADVVICAGAEDLGVPENVVRSGEPENFVRPAVSGEWLDFRTARARLSI